MGEKRAEWEAQKAAIQFETQIEQGFQADDRQSFEQYACYVINLKERNGIKHNTIRSYRDILRRIVPSIDSMKLGDIRPQHLNKLYKALQSLDERLSGAKAVSKETLLECIKGSGMTREALSKARRYLILP